MIYRKLWLISFFCFGFAVFSKAQLHCNSVVLAEDNPPGCFFCDSVYVGSLKNYSFTRGISPCVELSKSFFLTTFPDTSGDLHIEVYLPDCQSFLRVQAVLLTEDLIPVSNCASIDLPSYRDTIIGSDLDSKSKYLIMVDGFGDYSCNVELKVLKGLARAQESIPPSNISMQTPNISVSGVACYHDELRFSINRITEATSYFWEIIDPAFNSYEFMSTNNNTFHKFSKPGIKKVKVTPYFGCTRGSSSEIDFEVFKENDGITWKNFLVCDEFFPFEIDDYSFDFPGMKEIRYPGILCDSVVVYDIWSDYPTEFQTIDSVICELNPPIFNDSIYSEPGNHRILIQRFGIPYSCQTELNLNLRYGEIKEPKIECILDTFLNIVGIKWDNVEIATGYKVIINGETVSNQSHSSYLYSPKESNENIAIEIHPFSNTDCSFIVGKTECIGPETVSTNTISNPSKFEIFPNPSTDIFKIKTDLTFEEVEVVDFAGKILKAFDLKKKWIDLSNHPSGIYFFKIKTKEGVFVKKAILL